MVLSLCVSYESKSLLPGVSWHKGWLAVPDRDLFSEVKENLLEVSFSVYEISGLQGCLRSSSLESAL